MGAPYNQVEPQEAKKKLRKKYHKQTQPKANQPKNGDFVCFGYVGSVKVDAELGWAELGGGIPICGGGCALGAAEFVSNSLQGGNPQGILLF